VSDLVLNHLVAVESLSVKTFTSRSIAQKGSSVLNESGKEIGLSALTDPDEVLLVTLASNLHVGRVLGNNDLTVGHIFS